MKNFITILKERFRNVLVISAALFIIIIFSSAAPDTSSIDNLVIWIAEWCKKIGLFVAFFGGIQIALALRNEDSDGKVRGIKTLVSGFMVYAISKSPELFKF